MAGIAFLYLLHYAWTALGRLINKHYVYKYLDLNYRGPRALVPTYLSVMCLTMTTFLVQWSLCRLRETVVRKTYGNRPEW